MSQETWNLIVSCILLVVVLAGSISIYQRAGYRWWLGLFAPAVGVAAHLLLDLATIPVAVLFMFPHLALANWPIVAKAEDGMVWAGSASDKQIVPFLGRAGKLARTSDPAAGAAMCRFVMDKYAGTPSAHDAEILLGEILARPA